MQTGKRYRELVAFISQHSHESTTDNSLNIDLGIEVFGYFKLNPEKANKIRNEMTSRVPNMRTI